MQSVLESIGKSTIKHFMRLDGRWITLLPRNITIQASINRTHNPKTIQADVMLQRPVGVTILILKTALNDPPTVGDVAKEFDDSQHRIGDVRDLGYGWECKCESQ